MFRYMIIAISFSVLSYFFVRLLLKLNLLFWQYVVNVVVVSRVLLKGSPVCMCVAYIPCLSTHKYYYLWMFKCSNRLEAMHIKI